MYPFIKCINQYQYKTYILELIYTAFIQNVKDKKTTLTFKNVST